MKTLEQLKIKIFADGADKAQLLSLYNNPLVKGVTTNPTLMKKAGIQNYETFAKEILETIQTKPISFEVFSDEFPEMKRQALKINQWQNNVYVKIPITNTKKESSLPLIKELNQEGVKLNITALLTTEQVNQTIEVLDSKTPAVISVFAGRIADTGRDPVTIIQESLKLVKSLPQAELLWASVREILNIFQAEESGCHIVTVGPDILNKAIKMVGQDLTQLSLETVQMFEADAGAAGFKL